MMSHNTHTMLDGSCDGLSDGILEGYLTASCVKIKSVFDFKNYTVRVKFALLTSSLGNEDGCDSKKTNNLVHSFMTQTHVLDI